MGNRPLSQLQLPGTLKFQLQPQDEVNEAHSVEPLVCLFRLEGLGRASHDLEQFQAAVQADPELDSGFKSAVMKISDGG